MTHEDTVSAIEQTWNINPLFSRGGPMYVVEQNGEMFDISFSKIGARLNVWKHRHGWHTRTCRHLSPVGEQSRKRFSEKK